MLKLRKDGVEYEVLGHITFKPNEDEEVFQTNYTIVIDNVTTTIESTDHSYEVFEAPDPEPVVEEPDPIPGPEQIHEPTPEELADQEASKARMEWHTKKAALATMIDDMDRAAKIGKAPSETQLAIMRELADWIDANMKQEYYF